MVEDVTTIINIVINTDAEIEKLSQLRSLIGTIIIIPTIINAHTVTDDVNNNKTKGENNRDNKNNKPVTTAAKHVFPPKPITVALSSIYIKSYLKLSFACLSEVYASLSLFKILSSLTNFFNLP